MQEIVGVLIPAWAVRQAKSTRDDLATQTVVEKTNVVRAHADEVIRDAYVKMDDRMRKRQSRS